MSTITDSASIGLLDENGRPILDEYQDARPASADYADILMSLLPSGSVWPRGTDTAVAQAVGAIAPTFERCDARAVALLEESPIGDSLLEMLPEWEATFGLPDPCAGPDPTVALRQIHVRARLAYSGGQSVPYFVGYAAALGYDITITEFAPSRFGQSFGQPFGGDDWAYAWRVNSPAQTVQPFLFGSGFFGDPFLSFGNAVLECTLGQVKPAHTVLQFAYL